MRSLDHLSRLVLATIACAFAGSALAADPPRPKFGKPIAEQDIAAWNIDIRTQDGLGLPAGKGTAAEGEKVCAQKCVSCHGEGATGGPVYGPMVGGIGSMTTEKRVLTPGSMYPYAPILFDYIRRAMPMDAPQTLTNDEVYGLAAYILQLNGLIKAEDVMDAKSLPKVEMPNRNAFVPDDRPDVKAERCMEKCG